MSKYVLYSRVSTKQQDYGLKSQTEMMNKYVESQSGEIIKSYQEQESGKNDKRPNLKKALLFAKENNAILLVSKLDRLSRSVSFIFALKESGVKFVVVDNPDLNTMNLGIFATLAQHEREMISDRVKKGLEIAKKEGKIGGRKKGYKVEKKTIEKRNSTVLSQTKNNLDEIKEFAVKRAKLIDGSLVKFVELLDVMGFRNRKNLPYSRLDMYYHGITAKWLKSILRKQIRPRVKV